MAWDEVASFSRIQFNANAPDSFEYLAQPSKLSEKLEALLSGKETSPNGQELLKMFTDKNQFRLKKGDYANIINSDSDIVTLALLPFSKRQLSLLKLAARVILTLKMPLQEFENCVFLQIQYHILRWMIKESPSRSKGPYDAQVLYHRWVIRSIVKGIHFLNQPLFEKKEESTSNPQPIVEEKKEDWFGMDEKEKEKEEKEKGQGKKDKELALTYEETDLEYIDEKETIAFLSELLLENEKSGISEENGTFCCQVAYEVGEYHFFRENFVQAIDFFSQAERIFLKMFPNGAALNGYCTIELRKLKNTTLACRTITQQLSMEEKEKYLLLKIEELEAKQAFEELVSLLFIHFHDGKQRARAKGTSMLSHSYLRLLQDQMEAKGGWRWSFRLGLFIALLMAPKGPGVMISVLPAHFVPYLREKRHEDDRIFFFQECLAWKKEREEEGKAINEFVGIVLGKFQTPEMKNTLKQLSGLAKEFEVEWMIVEKFQPRAETNSTQFLEKLGLGHVTNHPIYLKRKLLETADVNQVPEVLKKMKTEEQIQNFEASFLKELVNRGSRLFEKEHYLEAEKLFLKAHEYIETQMLDSDFEGLASQIDFHLLFLDLKLRSSHSENEILNRTMVLLRKYPPPSFKHQLLLLAFLLSSGFFKALAEVTNELKLGRKAPPQEQESFIQDIPYLCDLVTLMAHLLSILSSASSSISTSSLNPGSNSNQNLGSSSNLNLSTSGSLEGILEESEMRAVQNVSHELVRLNSSFLSFSPAKVNPFKLIIKDRYLEIIRTLFEELEKFPSREGFSNPSGILKASFQGFIAGEIYNYQGLKGGRVMNEKLDIEIGELRINFELFGPWSYFSVASHQLPNELQENRIIKVLKNIPNPNQDLSLKGLKSLLKNLQASGKLTKTVDYVQKAEVEMIHYDYHKALGTYLSLGMLESSYLTNISTLKNVWTPATINKMMTCCIQLKAFAEAAILSQFSRELDYQKALFAIEKGIETNCFSDSHFEFFWDFPLLEFIVHSLKKKGDFQRVPLAAEQISRPYLGQVYEEDFKELFILHLQQKFLKGFCDDHSPLQISE